MSTQINKAIVAVLGGIVVALSSFGVNFEWLPADWQATAAAFLTAFFVWFVPNRPAE